MYRPQTGMMSINTNFFIFDIFCKKIIKDNANALNLEPVDIDNDTVSYPFENAVIKDP